MSLAAGTRFGPYEILSPLGAGGMGEVYRARDTRLAREVAIKVLPASFASDADRRARFEREAQAVAALSHPNIVAIHDTGLHPLQEPHSHSGQPLLYVVMELLAGQTLRDRLASGALPVRKAVEIAVQIARGLGAAHGKGLVHRDLKPENVFLLEDGQVKILDFGLARQAVASEHSGATQTIAATDPGTVMGTVGYMAPEHVRGQAVDARTDVFAFGAALYEMVSGTRAFQRETAADTLTVILTQDPRELVGSRPDLSPALDRIIRHCLEKNANERFQSARDVAFALETLSTVSTSSSVLVEVAAPARHARITWLPWAVAAVALLVAAASWLLTGGPKTLNLVGTLSLGSARLPGRRRRRASHPMALRWRTRCA
jgi:serine/threonine protein kinase